MAIQTQAARGASSVVWANTRTKWALTNAHCVLLGRMRTRRVQVNAHYVPLGNTRVQMVQTCAQIVPLTVYPLMVANPLRPVFATLDTRAPMEEHVQSVLLESTKQTQALQHARAVPLRAPPAAHQHMHACATQGSVAPMSVRAARAPLDTLSQQQARGHVLPVRQATRAAEYACKGSAISG